MEHVLNLIRVCYAKKLNLVILTWVPNVVSYQQLICLVRDTCIGGKLSANVDNVHIRWNSVI